MAPANLRLLKYSALTCGQVVAWPSLMQVLPGADASPVQLQQKITLFQPARHIETWRYHHPQISAIEVILSGASGALPYYHHYPPDAWQRAQKLYQSCFQTDLAAPKSIASHLDGNRRLCSKASYPAERLFRQLSSGERQRVLLMRSLMSEPQLLILDEAYNNLDIRGRLLLEKLLAQILTGSGVSNIARPQASINILHRLEEIPPYATHALLLQNGKTLAAGRLAQVLTSAHISELYTAALRVGCTEHGRYFYVPE